MTCPLLSHRNWRQLDSDLWRLEKWLDLAEGTQSEQRSPPNDMEQLEDVIQDHRTFLLNLESHADILTSSNSAGNSMVENTEDAECAQVLRDRLAVVNSRWEKICTAAAKWHEKLQIALLTNNQFRRIRGELLAWLKRTETSVRMSEPIDFTESRDVIEEKYKKFRYGSDHRGRNDLRKA